MLGKKEGRMSSDQPPLCSESCLEHREYLEFKIPAGDTERVEVEPFPVWGAASSWGRQGAKPIACSGPGSTEAILQGTRRRAARGTCGGFRGCRASTGQGCTDRSCLSLQGVWRRGVSVTSGKEVILLRYRCNSAPGFNSSVLCPQVPLVVGSAVVPAGAGSAAAAREHGVLPRPAHRYTCPGIQLTGVPLPSQRRGWKHYLKYCLRIFINNWGKTGILLFSTVLFWEKNQQNRRMGRNSKEFCRFISVSKTQSTFAAFVSEQSIDTYG